MVEMIHNLPWHPVNIAPCLAQELSPAELAGWTRPCVQMCLCSPVLVCCVPQPLLHARISGFAAVTLGWESHTSCATSHPSGLPLPWSVVAHTDIAQVIKAHVSSQAYRAWLKVCQMQNKDFNWLQEVVFKSFGKSWGEGQEVQCNMRWVFFFPK